MTCDPRVDSRDSTGRWVVVFDMMDLHHGDRTTVAQAFSDICKRMDQPNQSEQPEYLTPFSLLRSKESEALELASGVGSGEPSQPSSL